MNKQTAFVLGVLAGMVFAIRETSVLMESGDGVRFIVHFLGFLISVLVGGCVWQSLEAKFCKPTKEARDGN